MKNTEEVNKVEKKKENSKGKHKAKITVGDIIFRIIVILAIFLTLTKFSYNFVLFVNVHKSSEIT